MSSQIVELDKGQGIFGLNQIVRDLSGLKNENGKKFKSNKIRQYRRLILLEKLQSLKLKPTNRFTVITVLNWDQYQSIVTPMKLSRNTAVTQMLTNKNVKNDKNEKNINTIAEITANLAKTVQEIEKDEKISREYQLLGIELWQQLHAPANKKSEFIRIVRDYPRDLVQNSYAFASDYPVTAIRWKMFFKHLHNQVKNQSKS